MKKMLSLTLMILISIIICSAQSRYSKENLNQSSDLDLVNLLEKSTTLTRTGTTLVIVGTGLIISGVVLSTFPDLDWFGIFPIGIGAIIDVVGIPIIISGSFRSKRVKSYMKEPSVTSSFDISPCTMKSSFGNQYYPGVRLTLSF